MANYTNPTITYTTGTAGDDIFTVSDRGAIPLRFLDGAGGKDRIIITRSFETGSYIDIGLGDGGNLGGSVGPIAPYGLGVLSFENFESVKFAGTTGDDKAEIFVDRPGTPLMIDLDGGAGVDRLTLRLSEFAAAQTLLVNAATITSSVGKFSSFEEFVIYGGSGNDEFRTGNGRDELRGGAGSNVLSAGGGDDKIYSFSVTDLADGGEGSDYWAGDYTAIANPLEVEIGATVKVGGKIVASNVEMVSIASGRNNDVFTVSSSNYFSIHGNDGNDLLIYRPGSAIKQTASFKTESDGSVYGTINDSEFSGFERIDFAGGANDDSFQLVVIYAPTQISLSGGAGYDDLSVDWRQFQDPMTFLVKADGTIDSNRGTFSGFERFAIAAGGGDDSIRTGTGNDGISGGGGNDLLDAGGGDDVLDGGLGDDEMRGGAGDDIYYVDSEGDVVIERANDGIDSIYSSAASYTLLANVENLYIGSEAFSGDGTGNALGNIIFGNMRDNVLRGLGGDDFIVGDAQFFPTDGSDTIEGGDGNDRLVASRLVTSSAEPQPQPDFGTEKDIVSGGAGDDEVWVGVNDEVDGGTGIDKLNLALTGLTAGVSVTASQLLSVVPYAVGTGHVVNFEVLGGLYGTSFDDSIDLAGHASGVQVDASSGNDRVIGGSGNDRLFGNYGNDVIRGGGGNDDIQGSIGTDIAEFSGQYRDYRILRSGTRITITDLRPGSPDGQDVLSDIETLRFSDRDVAAQDTPASSWRSFAGDGFVGEIGGGRGMVFGTLAHQTIVVPGVSGSVVFDSSFNKGGDVIRIFGDAQSWRVAYSGSSVVFSSISYLGGITVPVSPSGIAIVFDDGARTLRYDAASDSIVIGDKVITQNFAVIGNATATVPMPVGETFPGEGNRIFMSDNGEVFAGGKTAIFGTGGRELLHLSHGDIVLDSSFNKGGDTIALTQPVSAFSAEVSGSNLILHGGIINLTIPVGPKSTTVTFSDDDRTLRCDVALDAVLLDDQVIGTEPLPIAAGTI